MSKKPSSPRQSQMSMTVTAKPETAPPLEVYITDRGDVRVLLLDGRYLKPSSPVVQAVIYRHLQQKGTKPKDADVRDYLRSLIVKALDVPATEGESEERLLDNEPIVAATVLLLALGGPAETNLVTLSTNLSVIAKHYQYSEQGWPNWHHFGRYLREREPLLRRFNVRMTYRRTGQERLYRLQWIDPSKIPVWAVTMTANDSQGPPLLSSADDTDDVFEAVTPRRLPAAPAPTPPGVSAPTPPPHAVPVAAAEPPPAQGAESPPAVPAAPAVPAPALPAEPAVTAKPKRGSRKKPADQSSGSPAVQATADQMRQLQEEMEQLQGRMRQLQQTEAEQPV